jgi:acetyl esterase/lipase
MVEPSEFTEFLFPRSTSLPITVESPAEYYPPNHSTPGLPATKRMHIAELYYQVGEWLDYYTGDHTLSRRLRQLRSSPASTELPSILDPIKARELIGEKNLRLFPQFGVAGDWPPTFFLHGSEDKKVPLHESEHLAKKLKSLGVKNELVVVEGKDHGFDKAPDAEGEFGGLFDQAIAFLVQSLRK